MQTIDLPMYPASMAGRLVKLNSTRVIRWLKGYQYSYLVGADKDEHIGRKGPVIHRSKIEGSHFASFLDLIDLLFVKEFLNRGISLQKIRKALTEVENLIGGHHFAQQTFFTNGRKIYFQVKEQGDAILELLSGGQWVITGIIKELADKIEFDKHTGFAKKWYPLGKQIPVVIDPDVSFGRPSIIGCGISTANVYDFFNAEKGKIKDVSLWFNIRETEVNAAIDFEHWLAAA